MYLIFVCYVFTFAECIKPQIKKCEGRQYAASLGGIWEHKGFSLLLFFAEPKLAAIYEKNGLIKKNKLESLSLSE